jgi:hypothetical protein
MPALNQWESFYLIVGGAAGALIGLQFVVLTLIAEHPPKGAAEAGGVFTTPTIIHFSAVLLLAALLRMPVDTLTVIAFLWGLMGVSGILYVVSVARRMRRLRAYQSGFEDYLFHIALPIAAYLGLAILAFMASSDLDTTLFGVAAAALVLLFTSIHNAWDAIAYHVFVTIQRKDAD